MPATPRPAGNATSANVSASPVRRNANPFPSPSDSYTTRPSYVPARTARFGPHSVTPAPVVSGANVSPDSPVRDVPVCHSTAAATICRFALTAAIGITLYSRNTTVVAIVVKSGFTTQNSTDVCQQIGICLVLTDTNNYIGLTENVIFEGATDFSCS